MFTTLLAVLVALVLGHVAPGLADAVRRFGWLRAYVAWMDAHLRPSVPWRSPWGIALALLPFLLPALALQIVLRGGPWSGLLALLYGIAALAYAWGPRDLDIDVEAVLDATDSVQRTRAVDALRSDGRGGDAVGSALAPGSSDRPPPVRFDGPGAYVDDVFRAALRRWFSVALWFLLLGPVGALGYRLLAEAARGPAALHLPADNHAGALHLLAALEWPAAQLMTLSLALVGHFDAVRTAWRGAGGSTFSLDDGFLYAAARVSVDVDLADEADDYLEEGLVPVLRELPGLRDAMGLAWRVMALWLAVLALCVLAGWVS